MNPHGRSWSISRAHRLGHEPGEHVAAVERRHGNHVEHRQEDVQHDEAVEQAARRQRRRTPSSSGITLSSTAATTAMRMLLTGPASGDDREVAPRMPQVAHVHRHRLRPAEQRHARAQHRDQRKQDRADPVDVRERIQRQPAEHARGRVAQLVGRPRMRRLVHRQGQDQDDERREDDFNRRQAAVTVHGAPLRRFRRSAGGPHRRP